MEDGKQSKWYGNTNEAGVGPVIFVSVAIIIVICWIREKRKQSNTLARVHREGQKVAAKIMEQIALKEDEERRRENEIEYDIRMRQRYMLMNGRGSYSSLYDMYAEGIVIPEGARLRGVSSESKITNFESLIAALYVRYIAIKFDDFTKYYHVLGTILYDLHKTMKCVDPYYRRYSSTLAFGGSHFDGARIEKPDEFDMDIVIRMPVNYSESLYYTSDITIEPKDPGFVQLKMGPQFLSLHKKPDWDINVTAYRWKDDEDYLSREKFQGWFKSVVERALSQYDDCFGRPVRRVDGVDYTISTSVSGPAVTLTVEDGEDFKMNLDLVPALRFPEERWPISDDYRDIPPSCSKNYWFLVPKPNLKDIGDHSTVGRSWRVALQNQERELIFNSYNLKQALRLMKKLRDAKKMDEIASYYIKTLFYWEVLVQDRTFWLKSPARLFVIMVGRLYQAVKKGEIPYFWNEKNNLIGHIRRSVLDRYQTILGNLLIVLSEIESFESDNYWARRNYCMRVAKFLLTPSELLDFYRKCLEDIVD